MASLASALGSLLKRLRGRERRSGNGLGAFLGVYPPTVLTILGVILYLRFGWVVGHAGLTRTLVIVLLANAITLVTALALSAVATNSRVGVGGAYYIVSRSLGLEIGAAIGLPLFLSQAFSVTLYAFALAESLRFAWPGVAVQPAALAIVLAVGALEQASFARLYATAPSGELGFWPVFAVFFPAVTGIMAGLGLSGDPADPKRAIPRGTLAAQLTGFGVYLVVPVLLALAVAPAVLREDPLVWTHVAPLGA